MRPWLVRTDVGRVVGELHREFRRGDGVRVHDRPTWPYELVTLERSEPRPGVPRQVKVNLDWTYHQVYVERAGDLVGVPGYVHEA